MSFAHSVELQELAERAGPKRADGLAGASALAPPVAPQLGGPAALRPAAVLARQAVLGNAHVGRVFRAPASSPPPGSGAEEPKKDCSCADEEHCTCPK